MLALIGLVILIGLGVWQVQRLQWKEALLAHVAALKVAPPRPVEDVLRTRDTDMIRVSLVCPDILSRPRLSLFGVQDGQVGRRLMAACPVSAAGTASVLVDLGFKADRPCTQDKPPKPFSGPLVGVLRQPDAKNFATPANQPDQNLWYWRDLPAMARALGVGAPAPSFIALEQGPPLPGPDCQPIRATVQKDIPNNHLQYAITWFGLAAALVGVYVAMLFRKRPD